MSGKQYHNVVVLTFVVMFGKYHVKAVVGRKVADQIGPKQIRPDVKSSLGQIVSNKISPSQGYK